MIKLSTTNELKAAIQ